VFTNGKLESGQVIEVKFPFNERVISVFVKNGQRISKGDALARLDDTELKRKLQRLRDAFDRSVIDLDDKLIDYGYRLADSARVPVDIMKMAKVKSNYTTALRDLEDALFELEKTVVVAPEGGLVADVDVKEGSYAESSYLRCCKIIPNNGLMASFFLVEADLAMVQVGMPVSVSSYGLGTVSAKGYVHAINPLLNKDGMIAVQAMITSQDSRLLSGMDVKIKLENRLSGKIVVPKQAVLQKLDRKIVFTCVGNRAHWNYVETGLQNEELVVIERGLKEGQLVIVSNAELLTNEAKVTVENSGK
jgi:RND family efflux transporter MFP subunit